MRKVMLAVMVVVCSTFGCSMMQDQAQEVRDGVDGADGIDGEQGPQGEPGVDGKDGADGEDAHVSGSRLKARYWLTEDGARQQLGFYDTLEEVPCSIRECSEMGEAMRCYPTSFIQVGDASNPTGFFADAQCDTPVFTGYVADGVKFAASGLSWCMSIWRFAEPAVATHKRSGMDQPCEAVLGVPGVALIQADPADFVAAQEAHD